MVTLMSYQEEVDQALRFGDVLTGCVLAASNIEEPGKVAEYSIGVKTPAHCVVLSPCCSISDRVVSLSPLIQVRPAFFDNPYLEEDLTRVNRLMEPQQSVPPRVWDSWDAELKQKSLAEGLTYAFLELFVYDRNGLFRPYPVHRRGDTRETNYYMMDFRNAYKVDCSKIISPTNAPVSAKCLQLDIDTRAELRNKISAYYGRVPTEDLVED